ncbi:hypothetical protein FLA_5383 [Filimonas lacunae]|nr:hypothetical protein FLA_5383 [Filimonas lacunae]
MQDRVAAAKKAVIKRPPLRDFSGVLFFAIFLQTYHALL